MENKDTYLFLFELLFLCPDKNSYTSVFCININTDWTGKQHGSTKNSKCMLCRSMLHLIVIFHHFNCVFF